MKKYAHPLGASYPATLADYKKCLAHKPYHVARAEAGVAQEPPYPEILKSWLLNGFEEVSE